MGVHANFAKLLFITVAVFLVNERVQGSDDPGQDKDTSLNQELDQIEDAFPRPAVGDASASSESEPLIAVEGAKAEGPQSSPFNDPSIPAESSELGPISSESGSTVPLVSDVSTNSAVQAVAETAASATARANKRLDPRTKKSYKAASAASGKGSSENDTPVPSGPVSPPIDDYYGLTTDPVDHIDVNAFQPDHVLAFEIGPGGVEELFEDVPLSLLGHAARGDWFVTSGTELAMSVSITAPDGTMVYSEGPYDDEASGRAVDAGSFRFLLPRPGMYTLRFTNPSPDEARTITFAWLVGRDDDDPFTARYGREDEDEDVEEGQAVPGADATAQPRSNSTPSPSSVLDMKPGGEHSMEAYVRGMLRRVSKLHKRIDTLNSLQLFSDVRYARHLSLARSTAARVNGWSLAETAIVLAMATMQVLVIRSFSYKQSKGNPYV